MRAAPSARSFPVGLGEVFLAQRCVRRASFREVAWAAHARVRVGHLFRVVRPGPLVVRRQLDAICASVDHGWHRCSPRRRVYRLFRIAFRCLGLLDARVCTPCRSSHRLTPLELPVAAWRLHEVGQGAEQGVVELCRRGGGRRSFAASSRFASGAALRSVAAFTAPRPSRRLCHRLGFFGPGRTRLAPRSAGACSAAAACRRAQCRDLRGVRRHGRSCGARRPDLSAHVPVRETLPLDSLVLIARHLGAVGAVWRLRSIPIILSTFSARVPRVLRCLAPGA